MDDESIEEEAEEADDYMVKGAPAGPRPSVNPKKGPDVAPERTDYPIGRQGDEEYRHAKNAWNGSKTTKPGAASQAEGLEIVE